MHNIRENLSREASYSKVFLAGVALGGLPPRASVTPMHTTLLQKNLLGDEELTLADKLDAARLTHLGANTAINDNVLSKQDRHLVNAVRAGRTVGSRKETVNYALTSHAKAKSVREWIDFVHLIHEERPAPQVAAPAAPVDEYTAVYATIPDTAWTRSR